MTIHPPGQTIGIIGGGQLGRMLAVAARRTGYLTTVLEPHPGGPAAQVCDREINLPFSAPEVLENFAGRVDVATIEFENIPAPALEAIASRCELHPKPEIAAICQNREREKSWLRDNGFPCPAFRAVGSTEELATAVGELGTPCVLKTAAFGYDGKGQQKITSPDSIWEEVWKALDAPRGIVENWIDHSCELSVICARNAAGQVVTYDPAENIHTNHILDISLAPARISTKTRDRAVELGCTIAEQLGYVGVLGVELFLLADGSFLVNELAPRTHNSGHHTLDACITSQFEQQVRAICGMPLGDTRLLSPVAMVNLLGDTWADAGGAPDWGGLLAADPTARLHLYGKAEPKRKRKMGHFTVLGETVETAHSSALRLKQNLATG